MDAATLMAALQARDRTASGPVAPPEGLYLMRVDYPSPVRRTAEHRPDDKAQQEIEDHDRERQRGGDTKRVRTMSVGEAERDAIVTSSGPASSRRQHAEEMHRRG